MHGTNAMFKNVIEAKDVHAVANKATTRGAQLFGAIDFNDDVRIEAKIIDPFGFHWVFLSLWINSRMERRNVCHKYLAHAHVLCTEYKTWKNRHVPFPNEMDIEEHNRFSTVNDALKGFENLALDLSCLKVSYLIHHYSNFQSHDCLLPMITSDVHVHLELLRSTEIAMCINPSVRNTYAVEKLFKKVSIGRARN